MKCPKCKEKLKVNRTVNLDGSPMTIRYYICPTCKTSWGSTERLDKKYSSDNIKSGIVEGVAGSNV